MLRLIAFVYFNLFQLNNVNKIDLFWFKNSVGLILGAIKLLVDLFFCTCNYINLCTKYKLEFQVHTDLASCPQLLHSQLKEGLIFLGESRFKKIK